MQQGYFPRAAIQNFSSVNKSGRKPHYLGNKMKITVLKRNARTNEDLEIAGVFPSKTSASKFCRKMNGHLTLESPLRVFYWCWVVGE